ncbi:NAD(P)H-quinone oxidoreductase [Tardiphaga sp. 709]|uniref:NAD(P)H-quinone oxidoreductase n=1 Tax=Tardiphaga sp. 709 TaxID=3076039 RepID=UPI0028E7F414|nr:NAD(P)H-quinone oxidoreductase [Tardiphaga sp. 709]WNV08110.1 NAD(P)H-quinone oxidoreductase [Tardiphaga sp. 709]
MTQSTYPASMKAVAFDHFGGPEALHYVEVPSPSVRPNDLIVHVAAAGINRADINYREGRYGKEPNFGDSDLAGLEIAGTVVDVGGAVTQFKPGDRIMGITGGGGYAELARIDVGLAMPVPSWITDIEAAAIPEAFVTAHQALFHLGGLQKGERVLIHGAGGGVGSAAVQLAILSEAGKVITTSSAQKQDRLRALGVDLAIDYRGEQFDEVLARLSPDAGVDVILDFVGGPYLERNIRSLRPGGRLIQIGVSGGSQATLPLDLVLFRRLRIEGTVMKSVSLTEKRNIVGRFAERWMPALAKGELKPIIDRTFALREASEAQRHFERAEHFGKILLVP